MSRKRSNGSTRVEKRRGKWIAVYTVPDTHTKSGWAEHIVTGDGTFDTACENKVKYQHRVDAGEFAAKPYTFGEAAYHWLEWKDDDIKEITRRNYERVIRVGGLSSYQDTPLTDIAMDGRGMSDLVRTHPNGPVIRRIIQGTVNLAMDEGIITGHRLATVKFPRQSKRIEPLIKQDAVMLNHILDKLPEQYRLAVLLMRGCGLRVGEAIAMETDAIHDGYLTVDRATTQGIDGTPKMRREGFTARRVPIPHWLAPVIDEHIGKHAVNGVLFPPSIYRPNPKSRNSKYLSEQTIRKHLRKMDGVPEHFTPHQLRKNYATQCRNEGIPMEDIEDWLGHKNLTRDVYAFQGDDAINRGRNLSDPRK